MRVRAALLPVVRRSPGVHVAVRSSGVPPESVRNFSFAPPGLVHFPLLHPGLRRGLHSFAASRLAPRSATLLEALVHVGRPWGESPCDFLQSLVRNQFSCRILRAGFHNPRLSAAGTVPFLKILAQTFALSCLIFLEIWIVSARGLLILCGCSIAACFLTSLPG